MDRLHIGIFGKRNRGKSSLINAMAGQEIAIVSDVPGTTTDPVKKNIEILGLGPVVLIDTAGIDDAGNVGEKRVSKSMEMLKNIDVAILLVGDDTVDESELNLIRNFQDADIQFVIVYNKIDIHPLDDEFKNLLLKYGAPVLECSAKTHRGIQELTNALVALSPNTKPTENLLDGKIHQGETIVLVMPQDSEAPEGRLILPQVQVIRNILDNKAIAVCLQPDELKDYLAKNHCDFVVTDSQVFKDVAKIVPENIPLTGFSIVLARSKGNFDSFLKGTPKISELQDDDTVLILESCTHTSSCDDIGRHKLPRLLEKFTGKHLNFEFVAALSPLPPLGKVKLAIQCGGCMVTRKQLENRMREIQKENIPISNYGMAIAYCTGIFKRAVEKFT